MYMYVHAPCAHEKGLLLHRSCFAICFSGLLKVSSLELRGSDLASYIASSDADISWYPELVSFFNVYRFYLRDPPHLPSPPVVN